ncbi:MAG: elongation factor P [Calditrichales bacterium]|nr:MAG: elongation factor P [Calditrichales bacterium]
MKLKATQLRKGMIIEWNKDLYQMTEVFHNTPGKGQASVQTKMKNLKTGTKAENRFRSDDTAEKVSLDSKEMEYLYQDGDDFIFMDTETYEQIPLRTDILEDAPMYMLPNVRLMVNFYQNSPVSIDLPASVDLKITETAPSLKTATVTSSYKPAIVETGLKIQVPPFISEGEVVRIDTSDGKYLERAK